MKSTLHLLASIIIIITLTGCQSAINSIERSTPNAAANLVEDKTNLADSTLSRNVKFINLAEDVVSGNIPRVQVTLQNTRAKPLSINYSFEWYNQSGIKMTKTPNQWKPLRLSGGERTAISGVAPSSKAVDFVFKMKESDAPDATAVEILSNVLKKIY